MEACGCDTDGKRLFSQRPFESELLDLNWGPQLSAACLEARAAAELRAHLLSLVGAQCTTAVNASITTQFATCLAEFDTDRHSYPRTAENDFLNEVCDSTCFTNLFSALDALDSADCLPSEDASDDIVTNLYRLRLLHTQLTFMCSRSSSNNKYCGRVLNFLDLYRNDSSSFTDSNCESIVNHGNCLGSILVAGEVGLLCVCICG